MKIILDLAQSLVTASRLLVVAFDLLLAILFGWLSLWLAFPFTNLIWAGCGLFVFLFFCAPCFVGAAEAYLQAMPEERPDELRARLESNLLYTPGTAEMARRRRREHR